MNNENSLYMTEKELDLIENPEKKSNMDEIIENVLESDIPIEAEEIIEKELEPEDWYKEYAKPDVMDRLKVHLIDTAVYFAPCALVYHLIVQPELTIGNYLILYLFAVYINFAEYFNWLVMYLTNGYTLGKKMTRHRVFRMDKERLTWRDVVVRSLLMKGLCNTLSCGIMNIASIIVCYVRENHRTLHDISAETITVELENPKEANKEEKRVEFK